MTIGGLPANRMFKAQVFNADNKGLVTPLDPITSDEHGVATVTLSHHEIVVLTTE